MTATSTVSLLFTDIVGSTELLLRLGEEEYEEVRREHFRELREAVTANRGHEIKSIGDGLMAAFSSAFDALNCAVAMQQAVTRQSAGNPSRKLMIRVGVNAGEPNQEDGDYFGAPVVIAQRLCSSAEGGQILVSDIVRALVGSRGHFELRAVGELQLKGFSEPVSAWEVAWEPPVQETAPDATLVGGHRSPLIGREAELARAAQAAEQAREGRGRVLVISGEPGIGKTRLSRELAVAARAMGFQTLAASAFDSDGMPPYYPFTEAMRAFVRGCPAAELPGYVRDPHQLVRLLPETERLLPAVGARPAFSEREDLLGAVTDFLLSIAETAPLLLVLDDLQWADEGTLVLFEYLAQRIQRAPVLLVALCRPEALESPHRFARAMGELGRQRLYEAINLWPLAEDESKELIAALAGGAAAEELVDAIHARTSGNPFFL
jgi:class 3 adenylate cyclase